MSEARPSGSDPEEHIEFPFPFPPYDVQQQLMSHIFSVVKQGKGCVGIFESPTGTGKTLSIITSTLHWLLDVYPGQREEEIRSETKVEDEFDWVAEFFTNQKVEEVKQKEKSKEDRKEKAERRIAYWKRKLQSKHSSSMTGFGGLGVRKNVKLSGGGDKTDHRNGDGAKAPLDDDKFIVDWEEPTVPGTDDDSLDAAFRAKLARAQKRGGRFSDSDDDDDNDVEENPAVLAAKRAKDEAERKSLFGEDGEAMGIGEEEEEETPKIILCSRTHSQLVQFVQEIKKTSFKDRIRCVSLGSRKNLCVNPEVLKLGSTQRINDQCLDLLQGKGMSSLSISSKDDKGNKKKVTATNTSSSSSLSSSSSSSSKQKRGRQKRKSKAASSKCPFLDPTTQIVFTDHVVTQLRDMEELHELGKNLHTCSYYGSRASVASAHLVTMPYTSLLHKATRQSLGVKVKGNVIVIDEAHNLIESINQVHSVHLPFTIVRQALSQLSQYLERYRMRLKGQNVIQIQKILNLMSRLLNAMSPNGKQNGGRVSSKKKGLHNKSIETSESLVPRGSPSSEDPEKMEIETSREQKVRNNGPPPVTLTSPTTSVAAAGATPATKSAESVPISSKLVTVNDFMFECQLDNINLFKLTSYIADSDIVKKLNGFTEWFEEETSQVVISSPSPSLSSATPSAPSSSPSSAASPSASSSHVDPSVLPNQQQPGTEGKKAEAEQAPQRSSHISALAIVRDFLTAVSNQNRDGRILLQTGPSPKDRYVKYLMLNPSVNFQEILSEARAVLLLGGTMQPFNHFVEQLFSDLPAEKLHTFACGHVVSKENVLAVSLPCGPTGKKFNFTFQHRYAPAMLKDLGSVIVNVCKIVPDGVVLFFPSYKYEEEVCKFWQEHGYLDKIRTKKRFFRELRGASVEETLGEYTECILNGVRSPNQTGALVTCVVGGKMSEGINFSNGLAR